MDRLTKAFVALSAAGIVIAVYHGYDEITAYSGPLSNGCSVFTGFNPFLSCTAVFAGGHDTFPPGPYGIPLYVYGLVWFPLMTALALYFGRRGPLNGEFMVPVLMVGNLFTVYLWYIELVVIQALCPVCVSMYILNYAMSGLAFKALASAS
ncbi:MAG: hypothetical protein JRM71_05410 [Nitrososphaerota archaeon]|nr:hypothetical protein [Nitrososphaerota archaeon]